MKEDAKNITIVSLVITLLFLVSIWINNSQYKRLSALLDERFSQQKKDIASLFEDSEFIIKLQSE